MSEVQLELEDAVKEQIIKEELDKAYDAVVKKPIFPQYVNRFTGELSPYKTPANYVPEKGVVNDLKDLCHTEDYVSIQQIYARLKAMKQLSIQDADYVYDERNLNTDDLAEDFVSDDADLADDALDAIDVQERLYDQYGKASEQQVSDSAAQKMAVESKNEEEARHVADDE